MQSKKQGFTIIELIVVITILAILGTIGFVSFSSHLVRVRDTNRQEQIGSIYQGLESYKTKESLPLPDDYVEVRANGVTVGYQGFAGKNVLSMIGYSKGGKDPKDEGYFTYYVTKDKKNAQLMGYLEEQTNLQLVNTPILISQANAADYTKRYATVVGKKLGILTESGTNTPIQELSGIITSGYLDVVTNTNSYNAIFSDQEKITGTGTKLVEKVVTISIPSTYKSCKEIYDNKSITRLINGNYIIKPDSNQITAYCDMINTGATIIKAEGTSNYLNEFGVCKTISLFSDEIINSFKALKTHYTNITIDSDITFYLQADNSYNNSYIETKKISDLSDFKIFMGNGNDNTTLNMNSTKDKVYCDSYSVISNTCGQNNKPSYQSYSEPIIIVKGVFNPFCDGSTATSDQWNRNMFSFKYSYYNVKFSN